MPGIIAKFGTPHPVSFREKGCDTEFMARISGAVYINDYDAAGNMSMPDLGVFAAGKIEEHLSHWHEEDSILFVDGKAKLESMLENDLKESGIGGSVRIDDITLTDEANGLYQEQIMKPYNEANELKHEEELEAADEPHGPLREFSYNLSSHGMMAGTSSGSSRSVIWNKGGTIIYRFSSYGCGSRTEREYKIAPETAEKIRSFVVDKRLAALSKLDIPNAGMCDNFTSSTISMEFDDSSIGGDAYSSCHIYCGAASSTFKTIEDGIKELFDECEATGECIKDKTEETGNPFGNVMGTPPSMFNMQNIPVATVNPFDGIKQMQENMAKAATESASSTGPWTCTCGSENTGKFCPNCGGPRV